MLLCRERYATDDDGVVLAADLELRPYLAIIWRMRLSLNLFSVIIFFWLLMSISLCRMKALVLEISKRWKNNVFQYFFVWRAIL
jgi:hypothetical protein